MANYERKRRSSFCDYVVKIFKFVPVLFIFGIIIWSYYAYVIQLSFLYVPNILQKVLYLIFYHLILFMFMWSYYQTIFTDIGRVPTKFRLPPAELESFCRATSEEEQKRLLENYARDLPVANRTINGAVRFCDKCAIVKPDRAHHCSVCSTCVLKMDHHCPWVNNCVNFTNYKYFILFLGYSLVYCLYVACTTMPFFVQFWKGQLDGGPGRFHVLFLTLVASMFAVSLVSLFGYHIYLVVLNRTTLEAFRAPVFRFGGPDKNGFSLGSYANFQQVFGAEKLYWFLPVFTSLGDGVQYPVRANPNYEAMGDTQPRLLDNSVVIQMPNDRPIGNGHTTFDASNVALTNVEIGKPIEHNVIV